MLTNEQVVEFLKILAYYNILDENIYLSFDKDNNLLVGVVCSDVFFWATSDIELIENEDDIELFRKSVKDCYEKSDDDTLVPEMHGPDLYCARKIGLRPQGAYYEKVLPKSLYSLFDEVGEKRDVDLGNPVERDKLG